ncbi:MAG: peptidylprolyl isomerase [Eggerthellaceae bacterium]|nr:peptidylprolyl isomerase [Eggerthellaceae bacterium]
MSNAGKIVKVDYFGTLDDGTKFDASFDHGEPLVFRCMTGMMLQDFDEAVEKMEVGETKKIRIEAAYAYGEYLETLVKKIPVNEIPNGEMLPVGETVYFEDNQGNPVPVKVLSMEDGIVTLDTNHPLAGKDLNFEITLLEVQSAV